MNKIIEQNFRRKLYQEQILSLASLPSSIAPNVNGMVSHLYGFTYNVWRILCIVRLRVKSF